MAIKTMKIHSDWACPFAIQCVEGFAEWSECNINDRDPCEKDKCPLRMNDILVQAEFKD